MSNENQSNHFAYNQELKESKKTCSSHVSGGDSAFDQSGMNSDGNHINQIGLTSKEVGPQLSDAPTSNRHDGSL